MDEQIRAIFHDVFGLPPEQFRPDLTAEDVESWDSVMHLTLLLTLEQKFGVSFDPEVGVKLTSVSAIRSALAAALQRGEG